VSRSPRGSLVLAVVAVLASLQLHTAAARTPDADEKNARRVSRSLVERVQVGAFVDGMQADPARLDKWETAVGGHADVASYYYGYGDVFPARTEREFSEGGTRKVLLSWDMGPTRFTEWSSGDHDDYLDEIAGAARAYPYEVYVRPWPEMNGDWQTFQPTADGTRVHGGTYAEFKEAWRYVVSYLRGRGADNLRWVFNPTADTYAETTPVGRIWPGAKYVDVLGLDGFNWGRDAGWGRWRSFPQIFREQYLNLTELDPRAPVWICEVASKEPLVHDGAPVDADHDKGSWVRTMFDYRGMPQLRAIVWFDADKERDWRTTSSKRSARQWRLAMSVDAR
jgi:mannan endo-1,4-beta-mannosidase